MSAAAAFDRVAARYDETWTNSAVGRLQREGVWRHMDRLFRPGERVLELGCGTGEDALHLAQAGVRVHATDVAPRMIEVTQKRLEREGLADRVTPEVLAIEDLSLCEGRGVFDGATANFGVLNCVEDLRRAAAELARLVRPGGRLVLCPMGRFCLWETLWHLARFRPAKAFRRLRKGGATASLGGDQHFRVFYPSVAEITAALAPHFRRVGFWGVGVFVPPSYVRTVPGLWRRLAFLDRLFGGWPLLRSVGDHRLLVFVRNL